MGHTLEGGTGLMPIIAIISAPSGLANGELIVAMTMSAALDWQSSWRSARARWRHGTGRPEAGGAEGDRRGLRRDRRAGQQPGPGRTAQPQRLARHGPQRHGGAGGGGLHPAAAHQRRTGADQPRLPAVRGPAVAGQAAAPGGAPGDRAVPGRRGRPRRRRVPDGAVARPADPPGRGGAVPEPDPLLGPAPGAGADLHARLMLVVITDTGRVEQRIVELPGPTAGDDILELRGKVNSKLGGKPLTEAAGLVQSLVDEVAPLLRPAMASLASVLLETLVERRDERIALADRKS